MAEADGLSLPADEGAQAECFRLPSETASAPASPSSESVLDFTAEPASEFCLAEEVDDPGTVAAAGTETGSRCFPAGFFLIC